MLLVNSNKGDSDVTISPAKSPLKLIGKKLYQDGQVVAEIRGYREWFRGEVHANYWVVIDRITVSSNFAYFQDAVKWVRFVYSLPDEHRKDFLVAS
jgi:hypothetical protein